MEQNYIKKQGINKHKETLPLAVNVGGTAREVQKGPPTELVILLFLKLGGSSMGLHYIILHYLICYIYFYRYKIMLMDLWDPMKTNKMLGEV